jgi:hypothetical protein
MTICVLFRVPEVLAHLLLQQWLSLKCVMLVDSAFCCHIFREQFLALAYGPHTVFTSSASVISTNSKQDTVLRWAVLRGACINDIRIDGNSFKGGRLSPFLKLSGCTVRCVRSDYGRGENGCAAQRVLLNAMKRCPNVQKLSVYGQYDDLDWGNCIPALTYALQKLTALSLTNTRLDDTKLAAALIHCNELEHLTLRTEYQAVPTEVAIPTLKSIRMVTCYVSDAVLIAIAQGCPKLEVLELSCPLLEGRSRGITDVGVRAVLQGCPLLRETDLECVRGISYEVRLEVIKQCRFTCLYSPCWEWLNNESAQEVLRVTPSLETVHFENCAWLTDATLVVCAQHCPALENIALESCLLITMDGVQALLESQGSKLREVSLARCTQFGDEALAAIAAHCSLLRAVFTPPAVSDDGVIRLAKGCPQLVDITLSGADVTDESMVAFATHCPKLRTASLSCCPGITVRGVRALAEHRPLMTFITAPQHLRGQRLPPRNGLQVIYW